GALGHPGRSAHRPLTPCRDLSPRGGNRRHDLRRSSPRLGRPAEQSGGGPHARRQLAPALAAPSVPHLIALTSTSSGPSSRPSAACISIGASFSPVSLSTSSRTISPGVKSSASPHCQSAASTVCRPLPFAVGT